MIWMGPWPAPTPCSGREDASCTRASPGAPGVSASWPPSARYYDEGRWTSEAELSALRRQVGAQHRMLSSYLNAFRRHGLWLDELREPVPASQWADSRPGADRVPVHAAGR